MIEIERKEECSGCGACVQACPKDCISLVADNEGFWYPHIDSGKCVDCRLCEKVCPVINVDSARKPLHVYAAKNADESVRNVSSSGGIFTLVAEKIIEEGGVVFGVRFGSDWDVVFDFTETKKGLSLFRGSKYVQAVVGDAYRKAEEFLESGRKVLFSGTPCQVAGLRHFLGKEYDGLLLMDLICEGVPSPKVWKMYLSEEIARHRIGDIKSVKNISFRNKNFGWKHFCFSILYTDRNGGDKNLIIKKSAYMQALFHYLYLRPICYECPFKSSKSGSDITISDYWGIDRLYPDFDDDKGASMVLVNTEKGLSVFSHLNSISMETAYEDVLPYNNIVTSVGMNPNRGVFYSQIDKTHNISRWMMKCRMTRKDYFLCILRDVVGNGNYNKMRALWLKIKK